MRATANLSEFSHVRVLEGDGTTMPLDFCDVMYVQCWRGSPDEYLAGCAERRRPSRVATDDELHDRPGACHDPRRDIFD